jgi:hypothetical protein
MDCGQVPPAFADGPRDSSLRTLVPQDGEQGERARDVPERTEQDDEH